jgi:hypothetical protein
MRNVSGGVSNLLTECDNLENFEMNKFTLTISETTAFHQRFKQSYGKVIILSIALTLIAISASASNWIYCLGLGAFVFLVQFYKAYRWNKYFIAYLFFDAENVEIKYKDESKEMTLSGLKKDFLIKKKIAFNRTRIAYLAVYYQTELKIKQFEVGEWNEKLFDKVIGEFNNALSESSIAISHNS